MTDKTTVLKSPASEGGTSRKLFGSSPVSGGPPVHFSGMTAEMSPPRVAIALEEVNLLQIFKQVKGEHLLTTIFEDEYRQYLMSHRDQLLI